MKINDWPEPGSIHLTAEEIESRQTFLLESGVTRMDLRKPGLFRTWWGAIGFMVAMVAMAGFYYAIWRAWG